MLGNGKEVKFCRAKNALIALSLGPAALGQILKVT